tara:strand:- start:478 stop:729 length:252 start_codon:yes stop_codon:yes gene_type:complete
MVDFRLVIAPYLVGAVRKYRAQTIHGLALPRAHLVRMHLAMNHNLLERLVAETRIKRHLGFESSRKTAAFRHLHIPPHRAEYP